MAFLPVNGERSPEKGKVIKKVNFLFSIYIYYLSIYLSMFQECKFHHFIPVVPF